MTLQCSTGQTRTIETPALGLLCAAADWYLAGAWAGETRFFRVDRMEDLDVGDPATPQFEFDLDAEWPSGQGALQDPIRAAGERTTGAS